MHPSDQRAEDPLIGRTIAGKFKVEAFVGRGAMGAVYRATQLVLKKKIAIKVMNPDRPADGAYASRFKREAKAASRLDHPNSLRVIDFGEDDGLLYMAMEFLEGKDLLQTLRDDFPLSKERIVHVLSQTLAALAVAHEMGVIHRDLKPENIMLLQSKDDEGRPTELIKVCDFGIAKILEPDVTPDADGNLPKTQTHTGTLTAHGMLIGTPEYMSPEQARGEPADARSDIYSLGVILFQLLTGRLPFIANSKIRLVIKHVEEQPPAPSEIDSRVDMRLEAICMKALSKKPEERYQSAREMRSDLRSALDDGESMRTPAARPRSNPPPPARLDSGHRPVDKAPSDPRTAEGDKIASDPPPKPGSQRPKAVTVETATAETIDPQEAAAAIAEARKRLSGRPPPDSGPLSRRSDPPPTMPSIAKTDETARSRRQLVAMLLIVVVAAAVVAYLVLSRR